MVSHRFVVCDLTSIKEANPVYVLSKPLSYLTRIVIKVNHN